MDLPDHARRALRSVDAGIMNEPFTDQDATIFSWLYRAPLTKEQIFALSQTRFDIPFGSIEEVEQTMQRLQESRFVKKYTNMLSQPSFELAPYGFGIVKMVFPEMMGLPSPFND